MGKECDGFNSTIGALSDADAQSAELTPGTSDAALAEIPKAPTLEEAIGAVRAMRGGPVLEREHPLPVVRRLSRGPLQRRAGDTVPRMPAVRAGPIPGRVR